MVRGQISASRRVSPSTPTARFLVRKICLKMGRIFILVTIWKGNHRASEMQTQTTAPTPLHVREGWGKINLNNSLWTAALTFGFFCWFIALSICLFRAGIVSARSTAGAWSRSGTLSRTAQIQQRMSKATLIRLHLVSNHPQSGSTWLCNTNGQGKGRYPSCLLPRATSAAGIPQSSERYGCEHGLND